MTVKSRSRILNEGLGLTATSQISPFCTPMYFLYLPIPLRSKKLILSRSNSPVLLFSKWGVKTEPETVEEKTKVTIPAIFCCIIPQCCRQKKTQKRPDRSQRSCLSLLLYIRTMYRNVTFKLTCNFNKQLSFLTGLIINKYRKKNKNKIKHKSREIREQQTDAHVQRENTVKILQP